MYESYQQQFDDREEVRSRRTGLFVGVAIVVIVTAVLLLILRASRPHPITAPTAFTPFAASDGSFKIDQPVGWQSDGGTSAGAITSGVRFKTGPAKIDVSSDLGGSLMADMAQAQNNQYENIRDQSGANLPPPPPVIEKVHAAGEQNIAAQYDKYAEQPMEHVTTKLGDGRVSEFTADGGRFVGKLHGYRATILSNERRITVVTVCPETNWSTLEPAFQHEIESVDRGSL